MRFPPHFLDEIRARLSVSQIVARKVQLKRAGREFKGLSPFKVEKSPSFFVNDQKGFYHCFASGEHGDIFTFLMKTEGLSFPEAVERLAQDAGVPMPKPEARDEKQDDERTRLYALLEASAKFFEDTLKSPSGGDARRYIEKRGLKRDSIARFRLGYAPNSKAALKDHLAKLGFTEADMILSGMRTGGPDIAVPNDRFRHRMMFPITDLKGRVIAFGGRALEADQPAKYLNSPETPLFHKGNILFNAHAARPLAHERGRVIAVEGYMDVVALTEGGFGESVAPLGTALTEDQLQLLWRMADEPILCFDGDSAGRKAAFRAVETVLPHLKPGQSVRFAFLPEGLDPDDMIRQNGPASFAAELEKTRALIDVLWDREEKQHALTTPEQRADFERRLKTLVARIADPAVRAQYERELRETLWSWNRTVIREITRAGGQSACQAAGNGRRNNAQPDWRLRERARLGMATRPQTPALAGDGLAGRTDFMPPREALLLKCLINHPWLLADHAEDISSLSLTSEALDRLRTALLSVVNEENSLDRSTLRTQLERLSLTRLVDLVERAITHKSDRFAEPDAVPAVVEAGWCHTLALHERQVGLRGQLAAAERALDEEGSEDALARIREIQQQLANAENLEFPTDV